MKFHQLLPLVFCLFLFSCERKSNKEMIVFASENLKNHPDQLQKILNYYNTNVKVETLTLDRSANNDSIITYSFPLKKNAIKIDENFEEFLLEFYEKFGIYRVSSSKNGIFLSSNVRNERWDSYQYIWLKNPNKHNKHYKYYSKNKVPKEISGWRYKLQDNWYLESAAKY
jgi:hypothetical protein